MQNRFCFFIGTQKRITLSFYQLFILEFLYDTISKRFDSF